MTGVIYARKQTQGNTQEMAQTPQQEGSCDIKGMVSLAQDWVRPRASHGPMVSTQKPSTWQGSSEKGFKKMAGPALSTSEVVDLKSSLPVDPHSFEAKVLRAIFVVQKQRGSLIRPGHAPEAWGFASRKVLAEELGIPQTDGNLIRISRAGIFLAKQGLVRRHMRCGKGKAKGATAFLIAGWALAIRVLKKVRKVVTHAWREFDRGRQPSGVSGLDVEVKPNWSAALSIFRSQHPSMG